MTDHDPLPSLAEVREVVRQAIHLNDTGEPAPDRPLQAAQDDAEWAAATLLRVVALAAQLDVEALKAEAVGNHGDAHTITAESDRLYDALAGLGVSDPT